MQNLMELKTATLLGFYALTRNCEESPKWFGMRLATGHKMKNETRIEKPSTLMISRIIFHLEHPSLLGAMPQKLIYSLISRTSVLLILKQTNIWIKGYNL
jgi:hypothetical protein